jgi:hypothetical protein
VFCFLFYCIVPLYVNVWCVENDPFEEFDVVEDLEDFEQQREFAKGKSLLHSHLSITTCILITLFIYLLLYINMMGPM